MSATAGRIWMWEDARLRIWQRRSPSAKQSHRFRTGWQVWALTFGLQWWSERSRSLKDGKTLRPLLLPSALFSAQPEPRSRRGLTGCRSARLLFLTLPNRHSFAAAVIRFLKTMTLFSALCFQASAHASTQVPPAEVKPKLTPPMQVQHWLYKQSVLNVAERQNKAGMWDKLRQVFPEGWKQRHRRKIAQS